MVPIYSVTTMFSYVWYWHAVYWQVARMLSPAMDIEGCGPLMRVGGFRGLLRSVCDRFVLHSDVLLYRT